MPRSPVRTPTTRDALEEDRPAGKPHEQIDARRLDLLGEPLGEVAERDDVVAVIAKRRRRDRQPQLVLRRQEIDVVLVNRRAERRALALEIRDQLEQRGGIEQRARQGVRAGLARLFDHRDRERLAALLLLQLSQAQRSREAAGACPDDQDIDVQRLASRKLPFLQFSGERRRDLEQIAGNAVVGDLEDRRVGVLVDRHDGARALHPYQVLNRA